MKGIAMIAKVKRSKKSNRSKNRTASKKRPASKKVAAKKASNKRTKKVSKTKAAKAKRKPQKKAVWKISPPKHGTTDVWVFKKDGVTIGLSQTYRFTFIIVDEKPNLTKYDPDKGINIDKFNYSYYEPGDDSFGPNWTFPNNFPLEEQERIKNLWHEEYEAGMMTAGWICDSDNYYYGDLSVEEVQPEYPYDPI
jgi:glucan-binding YG repeat protein